MRIPLLMMGFILMMSSLWAQPNCSISDLTVTTDPQDPAYCAFTATIDFNHQGTTNQFNLQINGVDFGTFPYSQLPITVGPIQNNATGQFNFVVSDAVFPNCAEDEFVQLPTSCSTSGCDVINFAAEPLDCSSDSTYDIEVDFNVLGAPLNTVQVFANGNLFGTFQVNQTPFVIQDFPWSGNASDFITVCLNNSQNCCASDTLTPPGCLGPCIIDSLTVKADDCTSDSTYIVGIDFDPNDPSSVLDSFQVFANDSLIGTFSTNQLPLVIDDFPWGGKVFDNVRVCSVDKPNCCVEQQIVAPGCLPFKDCMIMGADIEPGDCTSDSTYDLTVNFQATNPGLGTFTLFNSQGDTIGNFDLADAPVTIPDYPWNGQKDDTIRICVDVDTTLSDPCCESFVYDAPDCLFPCGITDLVADPGDCVPGTASYSLVVNFNVVNPGNDFFDVFDGNGNLIGFFPIAQLPVIIPAFPASGNPTDKITICINDNPDCCADLVFDAPDCPPVPCEIYDLWVQTGDCTSDSTYQVWVNFEIDNAPSDSFEVYANGVFIGFYNLSQLPVQLDSFPWGGGLKDELRICFPSANPIIIPCCAELVFEVPHCLLPDPCEIVDLHIGVGDCTSNNTYQVEINFEVLNPTNDSLFFVFTAGGALLDSFPINALPVVIQNFPWGGGFFDEIKICIGDNASGGCCKTREFQIPSCIDPPHPCDVVDLYIEVGECTSDSTYEVEIGFEVINPGNATEFQVFSNGVLVGTYPLNQLPLNIADFPWGGDSKDVFKVCIVPAVPNSPPCCAEKMVMVPPCLITGCNITDLLIDVGDCTSDSTYEVSIHFWVDNPGSNLFRVSVNGAFIGSFPIDQIPVTVEIPWGGDDDDLITVCIPSINDPSGSDCCEEAEVHAPPCLSNPPSCSINDLVIETGDCTSDSTYVVELNFNVSNPGNATQYGVWANGELLDVYPLSQLPLTIQDFPWGGGIKDEIKICLQVPNPPPAFTCCITEHIEAPACLEPPQCEITDLHIDVGTCTSDSTYEVWVDFNVQNSNSNTFGVYANGEFLGFSNINQLPLYIEDFPWDGGDTDVIKICITNNNSMNACCVEEEIHVPDCLTDPPCNIEDLEVEVWDCTSDSTYEVVINFEVNNPNPNIGLFAVFVNGDLFDFYSLNDLPLTINEIPWGGGTNDVFKICLGTPNIPPVCCETVEVEAPGCLFGSPCEIDDLTVDADTCTSDSTYTAFINFEVVNPGGADEYGLWANGEFIGFFPLNQLPLTLPNFPWSGGATDEIKICVNTISGNTCCKEIEFDAPDCLFDPCNIYNLQALTTPCLCGQFFAILTFEFENEGPDGFEIVGNGTNYGTFPYNTTQPIILGPFDGDSTTQYEFAVIDLSDPSCFDEVSVGAISCTSFTSDPGEIDANITVSPNPAESQIQVQVLLPDAGYLGQSDVEVVGVDGKRVRFETVPNGNFFSMDVTALPAGMYNLVIHSALGRLDARFVKQ